MAAASVTFSFPDHPSGAGWVRRSAEGNSAQFTGNERYQNMSNASKRRRSPEYLRVGRPRYGVATAHIAATCLMELRQGPTGPGRGARRDALIAAARLRAWLSSGM